MSSPSEPVGKAGVTYLIEFSLVMVVYVVAVIARPYAIAHASNDGVIAAAKLLPIMPIWLMLLAVIRHYRRIDEYAKLQLLKSVALGFGIGSCLIVSYSFLTDLGLPELAIIWAWPTLAASWIITAAIFRIEDR